MLRQCQIVGLRATGSVLALPAGHARVHHLAPQGRHHRNAGHHRQGKRQHGHRAPVQPQRRKQSHRVHMVVRMARRVQHHRRGKPMRGVPAVACPGRFRPAIRPNPASQPVMLDIISQDQLHLRIPCQPQKNRHPGPTGQPPSHRNGQSCPADIAHIRVRQRARRAL